MAAEEITPSAASLSALRGFEYRLLSCTLRPSRGLNRRLEPSESVGPEHLLSLIEEVISSIESGDYPRVLSSDACLSIFKLDLFEKASSFQDSAECAGRFYSEFVVDCVTSFINCDENDVQMSYRVFLVMVIAVAAFLSFTQCNLTGPLESLPLMPLIALASREEGGPGSWLEWEVWARNELMSAGSDLLGKFSNLQYIVFAKILLMRTKDLLLEGSYMTMHENRSISWWLARLLLLQQKILDEKSSSLFDLLQVYMRESLHHFGTLEKVGRYCGDTLPREEALNMVSMLHIEVGLMELAYRRVDSARDHFQTAESSSGLNLSLSGALGYRTVHQVEPKAQLVLVTGAKANNGSDTCPSVDLNLPHNISTLGEDRLLGQEDKLFEASDILMTPRFVETNEASATRARGNQNDHVASLNAVQQALILAIRLAIENNSRQDDLQNWAMAPFLEAVDSQQSSCFIIRFFCDILRIRWESTRNRTKERALLMMEKLIQCLVEPFPKVAERMYVCYGVQVPCIPALRREYGDILVRCGLIGEAVKVYEDLELWDNVIYCYSLLEKRAAAVELIKIRLSESPNDPRLWCSLGDVTSNDSCYEKALEVSENRSARAKRSLARSAYNRGEYEKSKGLWESAMALNSLYPDGWFALGAAALKARDVDKSIDAFTRAVQLDPENGEAWNNIACLYGNALKKRWIRKQALSFSLLHINHELVQPPHMMKKKNKESFIAFKEALKFKRNNWQLWENFSQVAADINNFGQAIEAVKKVLDLTNNKRIDYAILERLMQEIEVQALSSKIESSDMSNNHVCDKSDVSHDGQLTCSDVGSERPLGDGRLVESLGKVLQQIVKSHGGAEAWGLYARWHKLKGDLTMCSEALLKQVRSYQGSDLWKDIDRFRKFAHASLELCKVYFELSSRTGNKELITAEMHLKNTIKQAVNFSETEEVRDLQSFLDKVRTRLQSTSVPVP